jgi:hypothetical protein
MSQDRENHPVYKTWIALLEKEERGGMNSLTVPERNFYSIYSLELEIYNGGLSQYFAQGDLLGIAVTALNDVGAGKSAGIIKSAIELIFPDDEILGDEVQRNQILSSLSERDDKKLKSLDQLDDAYRRDPDSLDTLLVEYARKYNFIVE